MKLREKIKNILFKSGVNKLGHVYTLPKNLRNPWPGLAAYKDPFESQNKRMFCGRDDESFELTRMIDDNIFVTLYGKSGNGKTSLLNAGVFPMLRQMHYIPVSIRLGIESSNRSFQESIIRAIESVIKKDCIEEIWGKISNEKNEDSFIKPLQDKNSNEYLWNYFARHKFFADAKHEKPVYPVIVLDQFEEVYKNRQKDADKLLCQINYLMSEGHQLESCETANGLYKYEYNFRFVVSIREDDLYYLEDSIDNNFLQEMKMTRYRLLPISAESARDVILKPAEKEKLFSDDEKESIVKTIIKISIGSGESISSNVLSLICNRIYVNYYETLGGKGNISNDLIEKFVSEKPLEKFYLESTSHLHRSQRNYLEDNLVDLVGRRSSISKANFDILFRRRGESLLSGPLKILQESNGKVELIHDSFCQVLLDQKAKRTERWRTVVEHFSLMLMCVVAFFLIRDVAAYILAEEPHGIIQLSMVNVLAFTSAWWGVYLFFIIGVIHRSFASYIIMVCLFMTIYPFVVDMIVMRYSPVHLSPRFYLLSSLLFGFTIASWWFTRRAQPKNVEDRLTFLAIWRFHSLKIWLFVYFLLYQLVWMFSIHSGLHFSEGSCWFSLVLLPFLFFEIFSNRNDGWFSSLFLFILGPICALIYFTSDVEFLTTNSDAFQIVLITTLIIYYLYLAFKIIQYSYDSILKAIIILAFFCFIIFVFYALFYKYKFLMLIVWCLVSFPLLYLISNDKSISNKVLFVSTFLFTIFVYIFLKGYNPTINGVQSDQQPGNWRWNTVISFNGMDYRLLDALSGKDMLGVGFRNHIGRNKLILPMCDSVMFGTTGYLFEIDYEKKELVYYVNPDFESRIYKNSSKKNMVSFSFKKNRQRLFDLVSGKPKMTDADADIKNTMNLLINKEYEKVAEILDSKNDSIVKLNLNRQLCKGMSCDILTNTLERCKTITSNDFFVFTHGIRSFANSYYYEKIHGFSNTDWDGEFEKIMIWYIFYLEKVNISYQTKYMHHVIPALIEYYNETEDYGLKTQLYSKIVRLQQVAILYGMGKQPWAHYKLNSPIGENIDTYYKEYQKRSIKEEHE